MIKSRFPVLSMILGMLLLISMPSFSQELSVMTYNIRYDNPRDGADNWHRRKAGLVDQLKFYEPAVFGIQEGLLHQVAYLDSSLDGYTYAGVGRDDGKVTGEFSAVFYDTRVFNLLEGSTFWLSETPAEVSVGWDASMERICTWVLLEVKESGRRLLVFNTHFDHIGVQARKNSASLIHDKISEINREGYPVILMGDLNLEPDSEPIRLLSEHYRDTRHASELVSFGPEGTYNGFNFEEPVTRRIDYIFTSETGIDVRKYAVLSDSKDGRYYSDHLPVFAELMLAGE